MESRQKEIAASAEDSKVSISEPEKVELQSEKKETVISEEVVEKSEIIPPRVTRRRNKRDLDEGSSKKRKINNDTSKVAISISQCLIYCLLDQTIKG